MANALRIIFMGTPEFAVPSLELLIQNKKNIVAVITSEDKPQGRGQKLISSPVKEVALRNGIAVLQPSKLKDPEFIEHLKSFKADLQIVVAFRMLPEVIWAMPSRGTFNLHASLLPQYRGAAPINWAIINGEKETGATTFFLKQEIDTGEIIFQNKEAINEMDDAGSLYDRLKIKGAELVLKTVNAIETGTVNSYKQATALDLKIAPKIFKETCRVNWATPAEQVKNFVRGLSPYPSAWTEIGKRNFKIFKVELGSLDDKTESGSVRIIDKSLEVKCEDRWLIISELQQEGKKRMVTQEYLRGNELNLS